MIFKRQARRIAQFAATQLGGRVVVSPPLVDARGVHGVVFIGNEAGAIVSGFIEVTPARLREFAAVLCEVCPAARIATTRAEYARVAVAEFGDRAAPVVAEFAASVEGSIVRLNPVPTP